MPGLQNDSVLNNTCPTTVREARVRIRKRSAEEHGPLTNPLSHDFLAAMRAILSEIL
jgi:hypothetical protein